MIQDSEKAHIRVNNWSRWKFLYKPGMLVGHVCPAYKGRAENMFQYDPILVAFLNLYEIDYEFEKKKNRLRRKKKGKQMTDKRLQK